MANSHTGWRMSNSFTPLSSNCGLFSQIASSSDIVNTINETTLISTGIGSLSIPANQFVVGGSYIVKIGGIVSNLNNNNITFRIKSLGVILVDTGLLELKQSANQYWQLEINFTIRNVGGLGIASIISNGYFFHIRNNLGTESFGFNTINDTSFNTTILNTIDITAQWEIASASNNINSQYFVLSKIY